MDESQPTRNLKLVIAYNGAAYHGWQRQARGVDTVQLRVEAAAARVLKRPLHVHGASRTDSGVHAAGQVANIRTTNLAIPPTGMRKAMNSRLPDDIVIRSITEAPADFNSSRSATGKTYRYRIYVGPDRPVHLAGQVYRFWQPLNIDAMRDAAGRLVGKHDFAGFTTSGDQRANTVRTIFRCDLAEMDDEIHITVQGDGFLYNMVRNIVGTLVEVGRGRWPAERIDKILQSRDRGDAGRTAPPDGLTLMCVHY